MKKSIICIVALFVLLSVVKLGCNLNEHYSTTSTVQVVGKIVDCNMDTWNATSTKMLTNEIDNPENVYNTYVSYNDVVYRMKGKDIYDACYDKVGSEVYLYLTTSYLYGKPVSSPAATGVSIME